MRKYFLLSSVIVVIIYYISTIIISFTLITKSVVNNDSNSLNKYINVISLQNNFYSDIYNFTSKLINIMDKNIKIENESFELTGELSSSFVKKLFSKMSNNISRDFSNPEVILYLYYNSNEIKEYLNKSLINLGDYSFRKYLSEKQPENTQNNINNDDKKSFKSNEKKGKEKLQNTISKLIKRIKSTDYFFFTSPVHFKIDVKHQDIKFVIVLKFNGYTWKVENIKIPYNKLINLKKINLTNQK